MNRPRTSRFSPQTVAPEILEATFVARGTLLSQLVEDFLDAAKRQFGRYTALTGPRGVGKTHLMELLHWRLSRHSERGPLRLARLGEEEHVASLVDFFGRVLASLGEEENQPSPLELVARVRKAPLSERLNRMITVLDLRVAERPVLLFAENLDRLFKAIGTPAQERLRNFFQARPYWSVAASSCTWNEPFTDARSPFYQTFHRQPLKALTSYECHQMLRRLAGLEKDLPLLAQLDASDGLAAVGAIRHLLGGNPRAMAILFPFLRGGRLNDLDGAFYDLSEELTPYFQEQMARRAEGQQPFLEHLAANWYPLTVGELAELTYNTPQTASGQLRYLKRDHLVTAMEVGREHYYEIGEPLHRLAWAMKRPDRAPAALARFVRICLPSPVIRARWGDEKREEKERKIYEMAWRPEKEAVTGWLGERIREIKAMKGGSEKVTAAAELYLRERRKEVFDIYVEALAIAGDARFASVAEDGMDCFGEQAGVTVFRCCTVCVVELATPLRERCRRALWKFIEIDTVFVTELLLREHGATAEELDRAAALLVEALHDGYVPIGHVVKRLMELQDFERSIKIGLAWAPKGMPLEDRLALIQALVETGRLKDAEKVAEDAGDKLKGAEAFVARSRAWQVFGDLSRASLEVERGLKKWPQDYDLRDQSCAIAFELGDLETTESRLRWLLEKKNENLTLKAVLGLVLVLLGRLQEAIPYLESAGSVKPAPAALAVATIITQNTITGWAAENLPLLPALQASFGASPLPLPLPNIGQLIWPLIGWWLPRFLSQWHQDRDSAARLTILFGGADPGWGPILAHGLLCSAIVETAQKGENLIVAFLESLTPIIPLGPAEWMVRAVLALPSDIKPYSRLAAPEREFIRQLLVKTKAAHLLQRLPNEPEN